MNYAYDLLVNWNKNLYDFYEWNVGDEITHVRRIPFFKVSKETANAFVQNVVLVKEDFLFQINKKADVFTSRGIKQIDYACVISDGDNTLALKFDKNGKTIFKSRLLIDEDIEISELAYNVVETRVVYEICYKLKFTMMTRKEQKMRKYIDREISKLGDSDIEKLKYLYFDLFSVKESNKDKIIKTIIECITNNWTDYYKKIYNFFKILSLNK